MAGRPVVVSRGGLSGTQYGMIAFAFVSVLALGFAIFSLINHKEAVSRAESAESQRRLAGTPPDYYAAEARARNSNAFVVMNDDLRMLAGLVTGVPEDIGRTVKEKSDRLLKDIAARDPGTISPAATLLTAITELNAKYTEQKSRAEAMATVQQDDKAEKASLITQLKSTRDEFESQVKNLSEQLKQSQEDKVSALQQKDTQLQDAQATIDSLEQQVQKLKREGLRINQQGEIEIGRLTRQVESLQKELQAVKPSAFDPYAILTKAKGKVLRAIPGSDVVYINLGAADKMKVGMGFEVYSQSLEPRRTLRGKASVEVVTIMQDSSECRVTRRAAGQPIIEGDILVNIAYERNRKPKFVVRGDFDLNYDGTPDADGPEEVASLIRQWGGQVVPDLDESVDYVVVGLSPEVATPAEDQPVTEIVGEQIAKQKLEKSRFASLNERAQKMGIPVITQDQFLYLLGYAGEMALGR